MKLRNLLLAVASVLMMASCTKEVRIVVKNGFYDRDNCVVKTRIDKKFNIPQLVETTGGEKTITDAQIVSDRDGDWLYFTLDGETPAGAERTYVLSEGKENYPEFMTASDNGDEIVLKSMDSEILSYRHSVSEAPEGVRSIFRRSGFFHPVKTPGGYVVTNIRPADHFHHFGIWNPWTRVIYNGSMYDLWNLGDSLGTVRAASVDGLYSGIVLAGMDAGLDHVIYAPEGEKKIMDEKLKIRAMDLGEGYLWDFESQLDVCAEKDVTFQAYRYQGFCLRATEAWHNGTCEIHSSEGLDRNEIDGTRARWIYVNGNDGGKNAGILIMTCPENHNYPEHIRVWDETQNGGRGDIMLNVCPAKFEDWVLPAGSSNTLRYRVYVFDGVMTPSKAERLWTDFAYPPTVEVL